MQALIVIDMQLEMQRRLDSGRDCVNAGLGARIAELLAAYRAKGWPVLHVRHRDEDANSPFHPTSAGYPPMPCAEAHSGEPVFVKSTSSSFASTDLAAHLHAAGIRDIALTGAVAGFCVNSTARHAADLGFSVTVVTDAVLGFDLPDAGLSAQSVMEVTLALLGAGFASLTPTAALLAKA